VIENTNRETFGPATPAGWTQVTHWGRWTLASGGTWRGGYALTTPRTVLAEDEAFFDAGTLVATL